MRRRAVRNIDFTLRCVSSGFHPSDQPTIVIKNFWQQHEDWFIRFREYVAERPILRESSLYNSFAKYCDYRLGVVMDTQNPLRPSVMVQLMNLQEEYGDIVLEHARCQTEFLEKVSEYDAAKSNMLLRVQPEMERSRGAFFNSKSRYDDAKDQYNNLEHMFKSRSEGQKSQMEYENLKIEIQEGYLQDIENEIKRNEIAVENSRSMLGDGELHAEILPRLHQVGQKAESRKRAVQMSIEEMKRLRDKIAERNRYEEESDALSLNNKKAPLEELEKIKDKEFKIYSFQKKKYETEKEIVDQLEREKNKLSARLASVTSRMSSVVNLKFDKSQEISDYNVAISTATSLFNATIGIASIIYHSWKYYLFRAEIKEDTHTFIETINRETAIDSAGREHIKEILKKVSQIQESTGKQEAHHIGSKKCSAAVTQTDEVYIPPEQKMIEVESCDYSSDKLHPINEEDLTLLDRLLEHKTGPYIVFFGIFGICEIIRGS